MSDLISFEILLPRERLPALWRSLASRLCRHDRLRLATAQAQPGFPEVGPGGSNGGAVGEPPAGAPDRLLERLPRQACETSAHERCLTLLFPADAQLLALADGDFGPDPQEDGQVPVGCFWVTLAWRPEGACLSAVAATAGIGLLCQLSDAVLAVWLDLAREAGATALYRTDAWGEAWRLWSSDGDSVAQETIICN